MQPMTPHELHARSATRLARNTEYKYVKLDPLSISSHTRCTKSQMIAQLFSESTLPSEGSKIVTETSNRFALRFALLDDHHDDHQADASAVYSPVSDASTTSSQSVTPTTIPGADLLDTTYLGEEGDDGVRALLSLLSHGDHLASSSIEQTPEIKPRKLSVPRRSSQTGSRRRSSKSEASQSDHSDQQDEASHHADQQVTQQAQQGQQLDQVQNDVKDHRKPRRNSKRASVSADAHVDVDTASSKRRRRTAPVDNHVNGQTAEAGKPKVSRGRARTGVIAPLSTLERAVQSAAASIDTADAKVGFVQSHAQAGNIADHPSYAQIHRLQQLNNGQLLMERPIPDMSLPGLLPPPQASSPLSQPVMRTANQSVTQPINNTLNQVMNQIGNINQLSFNELAFQHALQQSLVQTGSNNQGVQQRLRPNGQLAHVVYNQEQPANNQMINQTFNQTINQALNQTMNQNINQAAPQLCNINIQQDQLRSFSPPSQFANQIAAQQQQQLLVQLNQQQQHQQQQQQQQQQQFLPTSDSVSMATLVNMASRSLINQANVNQVNNQNNQMAKQQISAFGNGLDSATAAALTNAFQNAPSSLSQSINQSLNRSISQSLQQSLSQPTVNQQQQSSGLYFSSFSEAAQGAQNDFQQQLAQVRALEQIQQFQQMSQQAINLQQWMQQ